MAIQNTFSEEQIHSRHSNILTEEESKPIIERLQDDIRDVEQDPDELLRLYAIDIEIIPATRKTPTIYLCHASPKPETDSLSASTSHEITPDVVLNWMDETINVKYQGYPEDELTADQLFNVTPVILLYGITLDLFMPKEDQLDVPDSDLDMIKGFCTNNELVLFSDIPSEATAKHEFTHLLQHGRQTQDDYIWLVEAEARLIEELSAQFPSRWIIKGSYVDNLPDYFKDIFTIMSCGDDLNEVDEKRSSVAAYFFLRGLRNKFGPMITNHFVAEIGYSREDFANFWKKEQPFLDERSGREIKKLDILEALQEGYDDWFES